MKFKNFIRVCSMPRTGPIHKQFEEGDVTVITGIWPFRKITRRRVRRHVLGDWYFADDGSPISYKDYPKLFKLARTKP